MESETFLKSLKSILEGMGIQVNYQILEKFKLHYNLLEKYNRVVNLTALVDPSEIALRLFADSLIPLDFLNSFKPKRVLDIGPGGGFPSIPLSIFFDRSVQFEIIEKRERVGHYLNELILLLELSNVRVNIGRSELFRSDENFSHAFDIILNKATFQPPEFFKVADIFLKQNGFALYWVKQNSAELQLPDGWSKRERISSKSGKIAKSGATDVFVKTKI